jgi:hypothetical protein
MEKDTAICPNCDRSNTDVFMTYLREQTIGTGGPASKWNN